MSPSLIMVLFKTEIVQFCFVMFTIKIIDIKPGYMQQVSENTVPDNIWQNKL